VDPAYVFAAVVIVGAILGIVLAARSAAKKAPVPTPFSDDRHWWWDGVTWKAALSDDGKWEWDGTRWQPHLAEGATASQTLAAGLANTSPGWQFLLRVIVTIGIAGVLVAVGLAFGYKPSGVTISVSALVALAAVRWWSVRKGGWGSPPKG